MAGGSAGHGYGTTDILDLDNMAAGWVAGGDLTRGRWALQMAVVDGGSRVVILGGQDKAGNRPASVEELDPVGDGGRYEGAQELLLGNGHSQGNGFRLNLASNTIVMFQSN